MRYWRSLVFSYAGWLKYASLVMVCALFALASRAQTDVENVLTMGRVALTYDDYITAIHYFNRVIEARPSMAEAYFHRADAKARLEDYDSAIADLDKAIGLNPFRLEFYELRGMCLGQHRMFSQAIADYDHVLQQNPWQQNVRFNKIVSLLQLKDYAKATTETDSFIARWPNYSKAYLAKVEISLAQKDTLKALAWADTLLQLTPRDANMWNFKGQYALRHKRYVEADSFLTKATIIEPMEAESFLMRAAVRHSLRKYDDALKDYDEVIRLIPQHFVAHYNRGLLRSFVGDDNRAIKDFDFVLHKEPHNTLAAYNRAILSERVGNYGQAIKDYTTLIKIYPRFWAGYAARARNYRRLGKTKAALMDETKVQRAELDFFFAPQKRASIKKVKTHSEFELEQYQQLKEEPEDSLRVRLTATSGRIQNKKVERVFLPMYRVTATTTSSNGYKSVLFLSTSSVLKSHNAEVCAEESSSIVSLSELRKWLHQQTVEQSVLLLSQEASSLIEVDGDKALALLKLAERLQPQSAMIHYNIGCVLASQGKLSEAETAFSQAIQLDDRMAEAYFNRAVAALLHNNNIKAIADLSKAGELGLYRAYNLIKQAQKQQH